MHTVFYIQPALRRLQGQTFTVSGARLALREALYPLNLGIDVEFLRYKGKLKNINTTGMVETTGKLQITLYICVPFHRRHITFTRDLVGEISILLAHEFRHRFQAKKGLEFSDNPLIRKQRGIGCFEDYPEHLVTKYLSLKEELDAYAYQYAVGRHFGYRCAWIKGIYEQYVKKQNPAAYVQFCLKTMMPLLPARSEVR